MGALTAAQQCGTALLHAQPRPWHWRQREWEAGLPILKLPFAIPGRLALSFYVLSALKLNIF